jgi:hypothetical protein
MSFKNLLKPTKTKLLFTLGLFVALGTLRIFTLENFLTGEIYKVSLFNQYNFCYQNFNANWYVKGDKFFWSYALFLHLFSSYILVCISAFVVNRLRGRG